MRQQALLDLPPPDPFRLEKSFHAQGIDIIAGVDEAGRGCLAGPVVAAAVILPREISIKGLKDSKLLSAEQRERLFDVIYGCAVATGVGIVGPLEIDRINILQASLLAMRIAVDGLAVRPQQLFIDGNQPIEHEIPQKIVIKGDKISSSIAAASIIAKVTRDRLMCDFGNEYPAFKFSVHKGYGTELHLAELAKHGPTRIHRKTFRGVLQQAHR
ncbi:MAG: ribonuclease HII [bacterium]